MERNYCAFLLDQRGDAAPKFCVFYAPVREVLEWALIAPMSHKNPAGVQRQVVKSRVRGIKRYFELGPRNTIPTACVVAFGPDSVRVNQLTTPGGLGDAAGPATCASLVELKLSWDPLDLSGARKSRPGYVIDGQHRLRGMQEFDPSVPIPIVAILDADDNETAFQFLVINNKQSKVPPDHVRALAVLSINESNLAERLNTARLGLNPNYESVGFADTDEDSPFRGQIKWPPNENGIVVPAAIETSIQYVRQRVGRDLAEPEPAQAFFLTIWAVIKREWQQQWSSETRLLEKVSVICLTRFITDTLVMWARKPRFNLDLSDEDDVRENVADILRGLNPEFFSAPLAGKSYDTSQGRDLIYGAIESMYQNVQDDEPWYKDIKVLDPEWIATHTTPSD